ncbi:hypothetical protein M413DRAFT_442366 [Hebeloma cylindrosporum]|uniref:Uncharacterized protein n=1 Tax=Hebeloma cylindrosporum TaxID=76867 RepID=A0A0C3CKR0_HEBCY|nr:hypothetical protein M413DRAFT_442366 [Hebeloma cylindrosporum h7]
MWTHHFTKVEAQQQATAPRISSLDSKPFVSCPPSRSWHQNTSHDSPIVECPPGCTVGYSNRPLNFDRET